MAVDPVRRTYWLYTDSSLFELQTSNETRDVWRVYLDKGVFNTALKYAKVGPFFDTTLKILKMKFSQQRNVTAS